MSRLEGDAKQVSVHNSLTLIVPESQTESVAEACVFVQAAEGASDAFDNARNARAAVGKTLRNVNALLAGISKFFSHHTPPAGLLTPCLSLDIRQKAPHLVAVQRAHRVRIWGKNHPASYP